MCAQNKILYIKIIRNYFFDIFFFLGIDKGKRERYLERGAAREILCLVNASVTRRPIKLELGVGNCLKPFVFEVVRFPILQKLVAEDLVLGSFPHVILPEGLILRFSKKSHNNSPFVGQRSCPLSK